jgi:pimeloyl-ACP methyl ester carboxylesterase
VYNIANFRIQRHHTRGDECRILAPEDRIVHWGTRASCDLRLAEIVAANRIVPFRGEVIVIVHGLGNNANTMRSITKYLNENSLPTIAITYPSTEARLEECAGYLNEVLQSMDQVERFHLVGFSMGGLVIRSWLKHHDDPRLDRIVFIGSPHYGAELADRLLTSQAFTSLLGPGAMQLRSDSDAGSGALPVPNQEFAVIAGAAGTTMGMNPLIPGDDDGMVSLASAKLAGASDHVVVRNLHALLPFDKRVHAAARRFIETGKLRSRGNVQPITEREFSDPMESGMTDAAARTDASAETANP